ncbi:MAG: L-lysine 6-transaminase [Thermoplasmata archaeon]|nr:L-lysine 6-transaminase [Thermoplasmata archaeon]
MITPKEVHKILGERILTDGLDMVLDIDKSHGMWLYDARHHRYYLDFFGFFATSAVGMNHPKMFEPEFLKKLTRTAINKVTNSDIYTVEYAEFVDTLSKLATPSYFRYFFFVSGGALAVENALKTAFDWRVRKNLAMGKEDNTQRLKVIHLREAFHGRSGYTIALTNTFDPNKTKYFPMFEWPRVTNPKIKFPLEGENLERVKELEKKSLEEIQEAIDKYGEDIAAFIMEPIQGEGGDNHFRKEYIQAVQEICKKNDIMFIMDEVQTGVGSTGKWWAHEHFDVQPDIMSFGKKMKVCGIMVGEKVDEVEDNVFHVSSRINSTFGGNIVDMVKATRILEIIHEDHLVENAAKVGDYFVKALEELQTKYPELMENARGRGLMDAFDLKDTATRDKFFARAYKNGLLCLKTGAKGIRFRPPLIAEEDHVNIALEIIERTIKDIS